jgi:protein-L-isoaspartate(D-aspartate) O-methyltransferase
VAFQTQLLGLKKGEKVLEVGTGSGYQTAILAECKAKVFSIERQRELYHKTRVLLGELGYKVYLHFGDGYAGLPTFGPFDKILVTAGSEDLPDDLMHQLKIGGWMVIPVGDSQNQVMTKIVRVGENSFESMGFGDFVFVPMLKGTENK